MKIVLPKQGLINAQYAQKKPELRRLLADTDCYIDGTHYIIKAGFWWDGKSAPKFSWGVVGGPFSGKTYIPALWHDILFGTHLFNQNKCDKIKLEMDRLCGVNYALRYAEYYSLRAFGRFAYNKVTQDEIVGCSKHLFINGEQFKPGPLFV